MAQIRRKSLTLSAIALSTGAHLGVGLSTIGVGIGAAENPARTDAAALPPMQLAWADETPPPPPPEPEIEPETQPPEPEVHPFQLGIAESDQETKNWMGFAEPTPHSAMKSDVSQPALDPAAGSSGSPPAPTSAAISQPQPLQPPAPEASMQTPERRENEASETVPAGGTDQPATPAPEEEGTPQPRVDDPERPLMVEGPGEVEVPAPELQDGFVGPPFEATKEQGEEAEPAAPTPTPDPAPADAVPEPTPQVQPAPTVPVADKDGNQGAGNQPGEKSDREADAASDVEALEIRPGRPAAAKGLEIVTKRPVFSQVDRVSSYPPHNPRLRVKFNREGRVSSADFLHPTGVSGIDAPVLHAVYRWTARGEALAKLPANDPKAGVTINVTILLR